MQKYTDKHKTGQCEMAQQENILQIRPNFFLCENKNTTAHENELNRKKTREKVTTRFFAKIRNVATDKSVAP